MHNMAGNVSTISLMNLQALGKVAAQNRCDPVLKSGHLKLCVPDARKYKKQKQGITDKHKKKKGGGMIRTKGYL